jgi:hypothetical protein
MPRASRLSLALVLLLAIVAAAGFGLASGGVQAAGPLQGVSVQPGETSAVVSWTVTDVPTKVTVEYGVDNRYGVWSDTAAVLEPRSGQTTLAGLEPGTTYMFHVIAVSPLSRAEATGSFSTWSSPYPNAAITQLAPSTATSTLFKTPPTATSATNLTIDGGPIFPRMVWRQCPSVYPDSLAAGINLFLGTSVLCSTAATQLSALGGRGYSAVDVTQHGLSGPGLIGWHLPDEGDESVGRPDRQPSIHEAGKVTFLTLTDHFAPYMAPPTAGRSIYPGWFSRADVIGFDTYPIEGRCRFDLIPTVYSLQKTMVQMAGAKPTFQWIEAGPMEKCFRVDPTTDSVRAETWLAIAAGARGIGYFPDQWDDAIRGTITAINHDIVSLAPALLDVASNGIVGPTSTIRVGVRRHNGAVYVIAVNSSTKATTGRLMVPGLGDRVLRVFDEGRTVTSQLSQIVDNFDGLGVHIYIAPPAGW